MITIEERLLQLINNECNPNPNITLDADLRKDLGLDSLSMTELIIACEDEFQIEIDMDHPNTKNAKTVRDLHNGIMMLVDSN